MTIIGQVATCLAFSMMMSFTVAGVCADDPREFLRFALWPVNKIGALIGWLCSRPGVAMTSLRRSLFGWYPDAEGVPIDWTQYDPQRVIEELHACGAVGTPLPYERGGYVGGGPASTMRPPARVPSLAEPVYQHTRWNPVTCQHEVDRGRPFCGDCPDHEACMTGAPCDVVKRVHRLEHEPGPGLRQPEPRFPDPFGYRPLGPIPPFQDVRPPQDFC